MLEMCLLMDIFSFSVYKKQITKSLKILVRLYSSFSTEVVSMLFLEFLLKAINSLDLVDLQEDSQVGPIMHILLDDWKLVITKLSNKEPELLLALLITEVTSFGPKILGFGDDLGATMLFRWFCFSSVRW